MENSFAETPEQNDAIARLRECLLLSPRDTGAMTELAGRLEALGDLPGAIDLYQRALRVDPYDLPVVLDLARLWSALGDASRARSWFARAQSIDPDSTDAAAGLAASTDSDVLTPAYIRTLFDQYADRFDADLIGTLKYRAPQAVAEVLERSGAKDQAADILDLGCGTGLSGVALHRFARTLDGIDLSPMMIAKARARAIYDDLAVGEAQVFLEQSDKNWDVIAAVDVLNYIGALTPVFSAAARRLRAGGLFAATVEKREEGGVTLTEKRRHRHGADHVLGAALAAGLTVVEMGETDLRQEGGAPVLGLVFALRC